MHDRALCANERLKSALNQILACLYKHLQPHVVRRPVFFDQPAIEGEFGIRGRGKAHLNFFESAFHQGLEQFELLADVHGDSERLVAITQIDAAPSWSTSQRPSGPLAVRELNRGKRPVLHRRIFEHTFIAFVVGAVRQKGKQKTHCQIWQWVRLILGKHQNPTAALLSSSAFDSSRFQFKFTVKS